MTDVTDAMIEAGYAELVTVPGYVESTKASLGRAYLAIRNAATPEPDGLVERLKGRAAFCRDRGEIKTPELLERAATQITELRRERDEAAKLARVAGERLNAGLTDDVHTALNRIAALTNNGGYNG